MMRSVAIFALACVAALGGCEQSSSRSRTLVPLGKPVPIPSTDPVTPSPDPILVAEFDYPETKVDAAWNETNILDVTFKDLPGWQACRFKFVPEYSKEGTISPPAIAEVETTQQPRPPKFHGYRVLLSATGSHNPLDRWGSQAKMFKIKMEVINARYGPEDRRRIKCDLPAR